MPIEIAEGAAALRLSSLIRWLCVAIIAFIRLDFEPATLVSLRGFLPLDIVLWVFLVDDHFDKWAWKSLRKYVHV